MYDADNGNGEPPAGQDPGKRSPLPRPFHLILFPNLSFGNNNYFHMEETIMALKNLFGRKTEAVSTVCGTACGSGGKKPTACGTACGSGDKKPTACGTACGAGGKK